MTDRAAQAIVDKAEPRIRVLLSEERVRVAGTITSALPYMGLATASFLGAHYLVPEADRTARAVGYGLGAILLGVGIWSSARSFSAREPLPESPKPGEPGFLEGVISTLVDPTSRRMAAAIVEAAEPRVRVLLAEGRERLADVALSVIPWWGLAAATCVSSLFLTPNSATTVKAAGYAVSAGSFLFGIHQAAVALETPAEQEGA